MRRAVVFVLGLLVFLAIHGLKRLHVPLVASDVGREGLASFGLRAPASVPADVLRTAGQAFASDPDFPNFLQLMELVPMLESSPVHVGNHYKRSQEHLAEFDKEWLKKFKSRPGLENTSEEATELVRLCRGHLLSACEYFRQSQYWLVMKYRDRIREMSAPDERDRSEARLGFIETKLTEFEVYLCREGLALSCGSPLQKAQRDDLAEAIIAYCLDGNPEYCREAGDYLRFRLAQKPDPGIREQARDLTARACDGNEYWACYDLVRDDALEPRSLRAIERLKGLCDKGRDPSACVTVATLGQGRDQAQVVSAVRGYCQARTQRSDGVTDSERSLCWRLSAAESVDESLWREITEHIYHGEKFAGNVLEPLQPPQAAHVQIRLVSAAAPR